MNPIKQLQAQGQSLWLDFISRGLIASGGLKRLVDEGIRGVTSNPTIFQKSICETNEYESVLSTILKAEPKIDHVKLYERLVIEDIQMATDVLRPIYDSTDGADGFVSLEAAPNLAYDTKATIAEVQRLWKMVNRPNLMIKVPATREGIPAIESFISQGINVNATLIFSVKHYEAVAGAYIRGLERNPKPHRVASVASFFVSRIDTAVDKSLEKTGTPEALALRGKTAIANSKMGYQRFREIFYGEPFAALKKRGARVQRPLWGSTGTKNPAYSDVLYVDELIGPDTVNTVPTSTLDAFLDHGKVRPSLLENIEEARNALSRLAKLGIALDAVNEQLQKDGVEAFIKSFDQLLDALKNRCQ